MMVNVAIDVVGLVPGNFVRYLLPGVCIVCLQVHERGVRTLLPGDRTTCLRVQEDVGVCSFRIKGRYSRLYIDS